ncbi:hypothetical protein L873DRAFT_1743633 [Choiromyces venosus 120613-1]|uniref:DUF218 domain-containing protein n=1 Tax=Choiromyces venosus 120613-1 TaxID=1336337 RepID=A0A3N4JE80_9PEZI|nr:hypothetical protein L873DRAFT_1743633 [Choiromyces venosus 120613-1]
MIEDFQRGEVDTYVRHIKAGIEAASQDPESLLVFSGGETKSAAGPLSEAESYYRLAHTLNLLPTTLLSRTTTEIHARDSYQNLIFSIARFHELTNTYPTAITLISHAFKEPRFLRNHLRAISYPEANFNFLGIDSEEGVGEMVLKGEARTRQVWDEDLYGCKGEGELRRKRQGRNPGRRWDGGYGVSCPELRGLLGFCPDDGVGVFNGDLPWGKTT